MTICCHICNQGTETIGLNMSLSPAFSKAQHILVIQPLVGIGDMIWHKPWIDSLIKDYRVTYDEAQRAGRCDV